MCNLRYSVFNKIPIVFRNGCNYDYYFIIKELAEEFQKHLTCLNKNAEKYITFTVSIEKEVTRIDKNEEEVTKKYILRNYNLLIAQGVWQAHYQILSIIFYKEIYKIKCKYGHNDKKWETCRNIAITFVNTQASKFER